MHFTRLQAVPPTSRAWMGRILALLLLCLTLTACFGSSDEEPTPAPTAPPVAAPTSAPEPTPASEASATEEQAEEAQAGEAETPAETSAAAASGERVRFQIDPERSEARFIVDEVLFGDPNTVIGRTNEVSGEIEIDLADPTQTTVSEIQVNARELATDNRFRNRSISRMILQSNRDEYQFITFTPVTIEDLPASAVAGDTFSFQMTGDLKIRDIVQPVTFDVSVIAESEIEITGLAQAVVMRADFELTIPNVEGVADVTEEVRLELEFVATASE